MPLCVATPKLGQVLRVYIVNFLMPVSLEIFATYCKEEQEVESSLKM